MTNKSNPLQKDQVSTHQINPLWSEISQEEFDQEFQKFQEEVAQAEIAQALYDSRLLDEYQRQYQEWLAEQPASVRISALYSDPADEGDRLIAMFEADLEADLEEGETE